VVLEIIKKGEEEKGRKEKREEKEKVSGMPDFYITKVDFEETRRSCKIFSMHFVEGEQITRCVSVGCDYL
jgi:hypothetical protein